MSIKPKKKFNATPSEFLNLVDAIFEGDKTRPGWVFMTANAKGRECVNALFPNAKIAWREQDPADPPGWLGFTINLPGVVAGLPTTMLPLDITKGANLDDATPDQLALILATGVKRQGGRSAVSRNGKLEIFRPSPN